MARNEKWVKGCLACRKRKTPRPTRAGITEAALASYPNETVAIDIWGPLPRTEKGNCQVLTMIDTFTRWPVAIPVKDKSSATIAEAIFKHWICEKSVPLKIVSDQAREFVSKGMKQLAAQMGTRMITTSGYNPTGNSSIERFHRYLNSTLSIVMDRSKANWDEYIPAILFAYRASTNDTTNHSPFFLETGREPQLPLGNLFPFLRKAERTENFVEKITSTLEFAFKRTRELQETAAEKNKARKPEQHKPDFKKGDYLLLQARSAKEGRLEARDENGKQIPLPEKLRNQFTGPFRMIGWSGARSCILETGKGKHVTHNVNRLIKHHIWDEIHSDTNVKRQKLPEQPEIDRPLEAGELIAFTTKQTADNNCIFGIGRILPKTDANITIQWYGNNPRAEAKRPFLPIWIDQKDGLRYHKTRPNHRSHQPWTNWETKTEIHLSDIIARGSGILKADGRISPIFRTKIENALEEQITWE